MGTGPRREGAIRRTWGDKWGPDPGGPRPRGEPRSLAGSGLVTLPDVPKDPLPFDPIEAAQEKWRERWGSASPHAPMAAATAIMRVQQLLIARFDAIAAEHGLTFARYEALVLLTFSRSGELPMGKIGERLMVHPTSATNIVQRLAASGYVERIPNPTDGRGALARITPPGVEAMEAVTAALHAQGFGLRALSPGQVGALSDLLRSVRVAAGDFIDEQGPSAAE